MTTVHNPIELQFGAALAEYGLNPHEIIADGVRRRFDADDDKPGKKSAWYVLHGDGVPAGAFGNWKTGLSEKWCGKSDTALSPIERDTYRKRIEQARADAETERQALQAVAAADCVKILAAARDATDDNPYCLRKGIKPYGLKEFKDRRTLIVPIRDAQGMVTSLQFIDADGVKRFKSNGRIQGCYYAVGGKPVHTILICEGFATGASLHQVTGYPIAIAFNAGNLEAVAKALRAKLPGIRIIICADNDRFAEAGNVGVDSATAAARAVGGLVAIPAFRSDDGQPTDFNDLHTIEGETAVMETIDHAISYVPDSPPTRPTVSKPAEAGKSGATRTVNLRCGADIEAKPITWLWHGWLPAGKLTILAGTAGTGKTTLALGLAATLTAKGRWPDGAACARQGNVLIWSSEDNPDDTLVPRLIASGANMKRCHFIEGITENGENLPFDPSQDIHELHKAALLIGGVSLLIVDPIVSAVAGDMHRANDVRRSLQALVDFGEVHRCAVLGITHFAKGGAGRAPQDRVIGSQAFGALARMVLVAAKEEGSSRRVLARAKSNIAPDDGGVAYSLEVTEIAGGIVATRVLWDGAIEGTAREILGNVEHDEDPENIEHDDLKRMLVDLLIDNGGQMPAKAIKAEVSDAGYSWTAANRAKAKAGIESAKEKGSKTSGWMWFLPNSDMGRIHKNPQDTAQNTEVSCVSCPVSCDEPAATQREGSEERTQNTPLSSPPSEHPSTKTNGSTGIVEADI